MIYRKDLIRPLTKEEIDANFKELSDAITSMQAVISSLSGLSVTQIDQMYIDFNAMKDAYEVLIDSSDYGDNIETLETSVAAIQQSLSALELAISEKASSASVYTKEEVNNLIPTVLDGKSAYELAVNNGFVGTETEWLASLKGATGEQGIKGDTGDAGATGEDGANGTDGRGIISVEKTSTSGLVDTYTITFTDTTTTTFTVTNGEDGQDGSGASIDVYTKEEADALLLNKQSVYNITTNEHYLGYSRGGLPVFGIEVDCGALPNATVKNIAIPNYNSSYTYWIDQQNSYFGTETLKSPISRGQSSAATNNSIFTVLSVGNIQITTLINLTSYTKNIIVLNYTKGA